MENDTPDWADMMEKAKAMAEFMRLSASAQPDTTAPKPPPQDITAAPSTPPPHHYDEAYDACIQTPQLRAVKAAIPHMEPRHRRTLSIAVKLMELRHLNSHYIHEISREQHQQLDRLASMLQMQAVMDAVNPKKEDIII